ncbi:UNVERIFIED_ORG: hypothetical protein M2193_008362 [Bradyrhizobium japonicum]|uniref:hypothetical protein n=1 Tax=Bradyrhizobium diazoefficiens TaxID=1355477 RepID=UPI0034815C8F
MPDTFDSFYAEKNSIINELFIATADDNYVLARWCFHQHLNVDFYWLAVHALEKYLKAILLLNGKSAKSYGHDVVKLYASVMPLAPELFPAILQKPEDRMPDEYWHNETMVDFIGRLHRDGQADNRYQLFGYSRQPEDLWKLDQVVYSVRRACRPLETYVLGKPLDGSTNLSNRDLLKKYPKRWQLSSRLENTMSGKNGDELKHAALTWNFPFAPPDYNQPPVSYTSASQNPVLVRRLYDPLEAGPLHFAHNDALWNWVKDNIQLPKPLIAEIEGARGEIKARSSKLDP